MSTPPPAQHDGKPLRLLALGEFVFLELSYYTADCSELDGGGVRGLVTLLILRRLMYLINQANPPKPCDVFDLIAGTSTGGLIAIMLGRLEMGIEDAITAYRDLSKTVFTPRVPIGRRTLNLFGGSTFDHKLLETAIQIIVSKASIGQDTGPEASSLLQENPKCKIFICAAMKNARIQRLRNYRSCQEEHIKCEIWEAARATSAAPTFFDSIEFSNGATFRDGALGQNNPIFELVNEVSQEFPNREIATIVSLGTGVSSSIDLGKGLISVAKACSKIATDTEGKAEEFLKTYSNANTCEWLLTNKGYESWLDKDQISDHHGFLWLKGKPGAGKSTMMKFAFDQIKYLRSGDVHICFFFNARGSLLERSTLGMYRSLLFQLFKKVHELKEVLDNFGMLELPHGDKSSWTIPQLQKVLQHAIGELGKCRLWVFVDALDECDEDEIWAMVNFFESLGESTVRSDTDMRVFFASRYYPQITIQKKVEIRLDDQEEHSRDIERYIQKELKTGNDTASREIREEVKNRASGVFLWAVLVIQILNKAAARGFSLKARLQEIPDDLSEIFEGILTRDFENMKIMRLCVQWTLFAKTPLKREELYFAILSGLDRAEAESLMPERISTEVMDAFILSCSKGLTQIVGGTVQFIHETVRDFLLHGNGMQHIQESPIQSFQGSSHEALKQCCLNQISSTIDILMERHPPVDLEDIDTLREIYGSMIEWGQKRYRDLHNEQPTFYLSYRFTEYALSHVLSHANFAEAGGVSQASFLQSFRVLTWTYLRRVILYEGKSDLLDLNLLYILATRDLGSLVEAILRVDPDFDIEGESHCSPLRTALRKGHYDALTGLLASNHSEFSAMRRPNSSEIGHLSRAYRYFQHKDESTTPLLQFFFRWGEETDVLTLLRSGKFSLNGNISQEVGCSPLSMAAERGYNKVVKFLLARQEVDPNLQDCLRFTPVSKAAREGRVETARLFVRDMRVDVNLKCLCGRSPLSYAAEKGHQDVVELLLVRQDVEVNSRDDKGRTPLFYAAAYGCQGIVTLLMEAPNADIISKDNNCHTALAYAVRNGHEGIVRQLLDSEEVEINCYDVESEQTALYFAMKYQYTSIENLLREYPGIDVAIGDQASVYADFEGNEHGLKQLWRAAANGNASVVEKLLATDGVDLNAKDTKHGRTPLWCAAEQGHSAVVKLLLAKEGVDLESKDDETGQAPLCVAARVGHKAVVQLLLANGGIDLDSEDHCERTPLVWAHVNGHSSIVEMLEDSLTARQ
ncbi:hypothetical protein FSARC_14115 [Fusarium sarcochroum]|uniref:phospholipase A2 n=1 Tax=Fusarium sarcochroum TaxID=1208366 RepID=A0A8H4WR43_9HYPO|nr:hypothetical protein FSARC_14115 [Fusarium sarcochroum]